MKTKNLRNYALIVVVAFSLSCAVTVLFAQSQKLLVAPTDKGQTPTKQMETKKPAEVKADIDGIHDFDFIIGSWRVHHRRLKERLANSHEWVEFEGTTTAQKVLGGFGNLDDNVLDLPGGTYRAIALRAYDPEKKRWFIWWLDSRNPGNLDPPVVGRFENSVGTFYADDTFNGKPVQVRFLWTGVMSNAPHWEQAFSVDAGQTWETNWIMDFTKVP
jgi:uncharacterized protein DUF1579